MKKLLIAMSAAAMFSLCAKADDPTLLGSTDFESYEVGAPITTAQEGGLQFWTNASVGITNEQQVVVGGESQIAVEVEGDSTNKYLKVDTTETLVRQTAAPGASAIAPVEIGTGDITVSAKVQFTAADDAPDKATEDKLIVWAKAPDADEGGSITTTNLMVTAKTAAGVVTNFVTDVLVDAEKWYDLQIVATARGDGLTASSQFVVKIAEAGQTPKTVKVNNVEATFYSLLAAGATGSQSIASIGFKGTGAVDNIAFAKNDAAPQQTFTMTITADGTSELYLGDNEFTSGASTNMMVGTTVEIYVAAQEGDTVTCNIAGATIGELVKGYVCVTIDTTGVAANSTMNVVVTVTSGGSSEDKPEIVVPDGGTVDAVIAAATSETGIPLANVTAAAQVVIDNANHTVKVGDAVPVSIAAFYTATLAQDMKSITLTLNDAALDTAGDLVEVSVDTTFGLKVSDSDTKLYYGLSSSATVNGTYDAPTALTKGTGEGLTLSAAKGVGSARFYKLYVTDIAPAPAQD